MLSISGVDFEYLSDIKCDQVFLGNDVGVALCREKSSGASVVFKLAYNNPCYGEWVVYPMVSLPSSCMKELHTMLFAAYEWCENNCVRDASGGFKIMEQVEVKHSEADARLHVVKDYLAHAISALDDTIALFHDPHLDCPDKAMLGRVHTARRRVELCLEACNGPLPWSFSKDK